MTALVERWHSVMEAKAEAEKGAGRDVGSVRLVAVSKFHPAEAIAELFRAGQLDFGENYMQEARAKQAALAGFGIRWHAIGPVQTNKAKEVAGNFSVLHTLGSEALARAVLRRLPEGASQDVLIQVNIGEEPQKAGVAPADLFAFVDTLLTEKLITEQDAGLHLRGLMCLPPIFDAGELVRPYFARMRELRDGLVQRFGLDMPELSMGMSGDFRQAIEEGATIIRVGTDIFGERPKKV